MGNDWPYLPLHSKHLTGRSDHSQNKIRQNKAHLLPAPFMVSSLLGTRLALSREGARRMLWVLLMLLVLMLLVLLMRWVV